jgi:hypothetical protein
MTDWMLDQMCQIHGVDWLLEPDDESGEMVWRTKDGQVLRPGDMTEAHLKNALALCLRKENYEWVAVFATELHFRAEIR